MTERANPVYEAASMAADRADFAEVRRLLVPLALQDDHDAQAALGTYLTADESSYLEGIGWLKRAADCGHGHAAHNLATAFFVGGPGMPPSPDEHLKFMRVAHSSGFEATVASDPLWWARKPT